MCGIAGIVWFQDVLKAKSQVELMKTALKHRGPDGEGVWISENDGVAFGHQRLSIIDLSENASQPMVSADERFVITYNGELYNYRELRMQCQEKGSNFKSQSDTEVIIECFRHYGIRCFERFSGMWALAIYDQKERRITLSRDPFGIKPLYYGFYRGELFFASEPKALRAAEQNFNSIDELTVRLFEEFGYLDRGEWTFFKEIKRFPHAHVSTCELGRKPSLLPCECYWSAPPKIRKIGMNDACQELRRLLRRSIELHLRSDVPVGACLSGGLDSSAIVCIGTSFMPGKSHFNTFTTRYPEFPEIDESEWAQKIVLFTHANARFSEPGFQSFLDDFDRLVHYQDEPFGSMSIYAQYSVFKLISITDVKVVLVGH